MTGGNIDETLKERTQRTVLCGLQHMRSRNEKNLVIIQSEVMLCTNIRHWSDSHPPLHPAPWWENWELPPRNLQETTAASSHRSLLATWQ